MTKKLFLLCASLLAIALFNPAAIAGQSQFNAAQTKAVEQIVHDYLVQHPEVLIEASRALQQQQQDNAEKQIQKAIPKNINVLLDSKGKPVTGNPQGNIVIVEFFDFQCPHCKKMAPVVDEIVKENSNVKVVFMQWPFFDDNSKYAAEAALASLKQNKYYAFHTALLGKGYPLKNDDTLSAAKSVGIDLKKLQQDMKDKAIANQISANADLAQRIGLGGAPAFIIINANNKKFQFVDGEVSKSSIKSAITAVK